MATATFTEVVDRTIGDPITEAIWDDQLKDNLNQLGGAHRNLLVNGGFEVWQRGAGAFTASGAYTADRWVMEEGSLSAMSVTQESTTIDSQGRYSLACVYTHSSTSALYQDVENWRDFKGKTVSFSVRVRQSVASMMRVQLSDGVDLIASSPIATTGSFVTHTISYTVETSATTLRASVQFLASGTAYLDNAMLVVGPAPAPYQPLHPQEDLARCQRYYEVHGGVNTSLAVGGYNAAGGGDTFYLPFATFKGGTPTVTKNGTWNVVNCGQPAVSVPTTAGFSVTVAVTALGAFAYNANSADDTLVAEYNP